MEVESFFEKMKPPRQEDAGLEDCALPQESIKEAFLKAAAAVRSVITASGEEGETEGRCVQDPWEDSSDALVGVTEGVIGPSEGCASEKGGGLTEAPGDKVAVGGGEARRRRGRMWLGVLACRRLGCPAWMGCEGWKSVKRVLEVWGKNWRIGKMKGMMMNRKG